MLSWVGLLDDPSGWTSLDYVHDQVVAQLDAQARRWDDADGRLRLNLGLVGVIFAAVLGLLQRGVVPATVNGVTTAQPVLLSFPVGACAVAALCLFFISGFIALLGYLPNNLDRPPRPAALRDQYLTTDPRITKLRVVDSMLAAYALNQSALEAKTRAFRWAFSLAALATGFLGVAVIIQVVNTTAPLTR